MKRAMDIEKLLVWSYREELPKREHRGLLGVSNYQLVSNYAEEMCETVSDGRSLGNRYWQLYGDGPHPDAIKVEEAVKALAGFTPVLHEDPAMFFSDMPAEVQAEAEDALSRYHVEIVPLVIRCASMANRPDWRIADVPKRVPWKPDGSPGKAPWFIKVEVKGAFGAVHLEERRAYSDPKTKRPPAGAYQKMVWEPKPSLAIYGRVDWLVWIAALGALCESVEGLLSDHQATLPSLYERPWETLREDAQEKPRVLSSVSMTAAEGPEREPRRRMLRREAMPKAGPGKVIMENGVMLGA